MVAAAAVAGRPGESSGTGGNDDEHVDAGPTDLLLALEDFEDTAWSACEVETGDGTATVEFVDGTPARASSRGHGCSRRSRRHERTTGAATRGRRRPGDEDRQRGSRVHRQPRDALRRLFRDANAVGRVYHLVRYTDVDVGTATEYATRMHDRWRDRAAGRSHLVKTSEPF